MLLLDAWLRSKLPATEFAALAGVASTTLFGWRKRVEEWLTVVPIGDKRRFFTVAIEGRTKTHFHWNVSGNPSTTNIRFRNEFVKKHRTIEAVVLRAESKVPWWRVIETRALLRREGYDVYRDAEPETIPDGGWATKILPIARE